MNKAVFGIYKSRRESEIAVHALRTNGFINSEISVLLPELMGQQDFLHIKASKAPEGVLASASTGAVLGGTLGLLANIGTLTVPGAGPFIAVGPLLTSLVAALAGLGLGGALGAVGAALVVFGISEHEAKKYESFVHKGGVLVSINVGDADWAVKAKNVLEMTGAIDVAMSAELQVSRDVLRPPRPEAESMAKFY